MDEQEDRINKKDVDLGLDVSTSVIGICFLNNETGSLELLEHVDLTDIKGLWPKADEFETKIKELVSENKFNIKRVYVEENMKMFSPGFSSADTILTLAKMNGICSYVCYKLFSGITIIDVNVRSARAKLGIKVDYKDKSKTTKEKILDHVMNIHPEFPWISHIAKLGKNKGNLVYDKCNTDRCDAWVIASGGRRILK